MEEKSDDNKVQKSSHALREESILKFWRENGIFEKTLETPVNGKKWRGEFVFYEGPPTANGRPGIHHLEARAFKDAIPRYKTMCGYHVRRKGGWDTHGLPVELQVEKELGLSSKKDIEKYGIDRFNRKCRESVWSYVHEWERFTDRMGYWVDLKNPYITYRTPYIESLWNIVKTVDDKGLLYKDYKVVPWCPRCGTALSSHELAQGYATVKDLAMTVKFRSRQDPGTYFLAWTTTPWTLPGNVALAVNPKIEYVKAKMGEETYILAKDRLGIIQGQYQVTDTIKGQQLVGQAYEPLFQFLEQKTNDKARLGNAYKIVPAGFVNTEEGTGIVHTAVMYGQDDFELAEPYQLPKVHLVNEDGTFKDGTGFLSGRFVKDEETNVDILKDVAGRGLLFAKEKYEHSYPFCWRCKTPLIYFARDSWYIRMSELRDTLVRENERIHWEPEHIRDGRFGEWLRDIKDWAISRERYWGTPLPVWICDKCGKRKTVGSIAELAQKPRNRYFIMRHGEAENNAKGILDGMPDSTSHLTELGREQVKKSAKALKKEKIDVIFASPLARTLDTARLVQSELGLPENAVTTDMRLREMAFGGWNGKDENSFALEHPVSERFDSESSGVESYMSIKKRVGEFLYDIESRHTGKNILIVTHASPAMMLVSAALGLDKTGSLREEEEHYIQKAEVRKLDFRVLSHTDEYELDLHRPYIDAVKLPCPCGGAMSRVKEVMDVWFDSGAMPFAQDHYPFENKKFIDGPGYPADFISEAIDQTRGWFYTLHAVGVLMGKGRAYKNVVCLGHILDAEGKKMSKSLGNVVNPWDMMDKYGADALRMWMYSVNQPGDSKNFEEKTVDEVNKKVFNLAVNVLAFYEMHADPAAAGDADAVGKHVLDRWILARLAELGQEVTEGLENYRFFEPTRSIREFIGDLSQWYIRRSRERFKSEDALVKKEAVATTRHVLVNLARLMAPFTPFFAEYLYRGARGEGQSVHLSSWPQFKTRKSDKQTIADMAIARQISSKALEARMKAKINVRQPLSELKIKKGSALAGQPLSDELADIVKDEINVKKISWNDDMTADLELNTTITPELREEGELREIIRKIQDLRKEKGLKINDPATLIVPDALKDLVGRNMEYIKNATKLSGIEPGAELGIKV